MQNAGLRQRIVKGQKSHPVLLGVRSMAEQKASAHRVSYAMCASCALRSACSRGLKHLIQSSRLIQPASIANPKKASFSTWPSSLSRGAFTVSSAKMRLVRHCLVLVEAPQDMCWEQISNKVIWATLARSFQQCARDLGGDIQRAAPLAVEHEKTRRTNML